MRAYFKTRPHLIVSIGLHLVVFVGLLIFFVLKSCSKEKTLYVFEMVEVVEEQNLSAQSKADTEPKQKPKPKLKPSVPEKTAIERLNYEEFLKENAKPKPKSKPKQNLVEPLPKFQDPKADRQALVKPSQSYNTRLLQEYGQYVYRRISSQWVKPSDKSWKELSARVRFIVLADGRIESAKIEESSGNSSFDQSILNVFKTIGYFKTPPSGKKETFIMNFRLEDSV